MIRIIGGKYKGKRLKKVPGTVVRTMPDKLKESLFSIIQEDVRGCVFLDGFAGSGSVGIEALSRGAEKIVFIDEYYPAIKVIKTNIAKVDAEERVRVLHKEFNRGVIQLSNEKMKFDMIFLDPPYRLLEERNPLKVIKKREILAEGGKIILRRFYKTKFDGKYFDLKRQVTLGDDTILFYT
jgi:16S rRNA (guanine966-N2)-methyltransferase